MNLFSSAVDVPVPRTIEDYAKQNIQNMNIEVKDNDHVVPCYSTDEDNDSICVVGLDRSRKDSPIGALRDRIIAGEYKGDGGKVRLVINCAKLLRKRADKEALMLVLRKHGVGDIACVFYD